MASARYSDANLIDALAREYVLGSLHGAARRRFEQITQASLVARRSVTEWERRLAPLAEDVEPVTPPGDTWQGIAGRLGIGTGRPVRGAGIWQGIAAVLAVIGVALAAFIVTQAPPSPGADYVAVVSDEELGAVWLLQAFADAGELSVDTVNERPLPDDSDYELWMLPDDGTAPVSLGLIPSVGGAVLGLVDAQLQVLMQTSTLAVSVEPAGGSPTGAPTGPVIYTAPLLAS